MLETIKEIEDAIRQDALDVRIENGRWVVVQFRKVRFKIPLERPRFPEAGDIK